MIEHFVKSAWRNSVRDKVYALTNLVGLSLAITSCLILFFYLADELSYDKHNELHDRIVRVVNEITTSGSENKIAFTAQSLGPLFENEYSEDGEFVRIRNLIIPRNVFRSGDIEIPWDDVRFADKNIFDVFTHEPVYGSFEGALEEPTSIVISESFAKSYFGDRNPIGESVSTDAFTYEVTAVFADLPKNAHVRYSALISMNRLGVFGINDQNISPEQLFSVTTYTYFLLNPETSVTTFQRHLDDFRDRNTLDVGQGINSTIKFTVQPLTSIHFDSGYAYDQPTGSIFYIYAFLAVAGFLIVVATINYTNLATARAIRRGKEIGVRKVVGATRGQLVLQFLGESVAYSLVALVVGLALVYSIDALTPLSSLLGKDELINLGDNPLMLLWVVLGALGVGVLSGIYPALYLSSIPVLQALSANRRMRGSGLHFRNVLVFLQLFVSIAVVASTILMGLQMQYLFNKPLGYEQDNRVAVLLRGMDVITKIPVIKTELLKHSGVLGVTTSSFVPGDSVNISLIEIENNQGQMEPATSNQIVVGDDFVEVMGLEMQRGRDFSKRLLTDVGSSVVVNEALVRQMGWEDPIGKRIRIDNSRVIGVVKDFHFESLHQPLGAVILRSVPLDQLERVTGVERNLASLQLVIRIDEQDVSESIEHIRTTMKQFDSNHPFDYHFFDDLIEQIYRGETNLVKLTSVFAVICIFISCLGLIGLAAFTTSQRTKEIGIRKVLGASTAQIMILLSRTLMFLMLFAALFASFATFTVMREWLNGFAYKAEIEPWVFLVSSLGMAALGLSIVVIQSMKTAQAQPSQALRHD